MKSATTALTKKIKLYEEQLANILRNLEEKHNKATAKYRVQQYADANNQLNTALQYYEETQKKTITIVLEFKQTLEGSTLNEAQQKRLNNITELNAKILRKITLMQQTQIALQKILASLETPNEAKETPRETLSEKKPVEIISQPLEETPLTLPVEIVQEKTPQLPAQKTPPQEVGHDENAMYSPPESLDDEVVPITEIDKVLQALQTWLSQNEPSELHGKINTLISIVVDLREQRQASDEFLSATLNHTHQLLMNNYSIEEYQQEAAKLKSSPTLTLRLLGGVMAAIGLLVLALGVALAPTGVAAVGAVIAGGVFMSAGSGLTAYSFFTKGKHPELGHALADVAASKLNGSTVANHEEENTSLMLQTN
ncbi:hypothetical protein [Legionella septentrionalis]|uniref:Uncharacterized protein n=1 Tax=Legionella septentrionalis TaxID=2498109 RepID=A0A3S0VAT1_9GAMM|nr:hypothetical protein [Legionella septentrionalis]RUQ88684.1 hypothetical protein EKM59_05080 [Legionella septentrionalis]